MPKVEQSIEIKVPVTAAYDQWTRFEEFPNFMNGVEEVRQLDDTHLHWVAEIGGTREEWDAEITEQHPDERIAWKSIGGKNNAGVVTFQGLDDHRCEIMLRLDWESEGMIEKLGSAIGQDDRQVKSDLQRFKEFVESRGSETDGWRGQVEQGVRR